MLSAFFFLCFETVHAQILDFLPSNKQENVVASKIFLQGYQKQIPFNLESNGWSDDHGAHLPGVRISLGLPLVNMADQMAMFGGHRLYDSVFTKFYALPYGVGDNGGCVFSVEMTYAPALGANCGAGGWDAVAEYALATNNPPWYITGDKIKDENGITHTVKFTDTSAIVRPQLPKSYKDFMHQGMHVMTNIVAGNTIYSGVDLDGVNSHRNQDQQFYGNSLRAWYDGTDSISSFTKFIMTSQWQPINGDKVDAGHIPSPGSGNTKNKNNRVDYLDKVQYSEFNSPILVLGTYIKHFTRNTSCEVIVRGGSDGTAVKRYGPSRKCDEELDNWYQGPDYGATMHGLTIGAGFDNKVSTDSYGLGVANWY